MDKATLYEKLDIESPEEFKYIDNINALFEEDDYIETNLIEDLLSEVDLDDLHELVSDYFEEYMKDIPDEESDLYIVVDAISRVMKGYVQNMPAEESALPLANERQKFRKWYVHDCNAFDKISGDEVSLRDARYNVLAGKFISEVHNYDYSTAYLYEFDGYDVSIGNMLSEGEIN